jgi:hypothetical protein
MADSKQLRILKGLTTHIEGVTPDNGYEFDLTGRVYRGVTKFGADQPLPFVSILEALRPDPQPLEAGLERLTREEGWDLLVQGWVDEDRDFPTDLLYQLKAAVEKRVAEIVQEASPAYRLGKLISGLRIGPGVVRAATPQPGGAEAFYLPLHVRYAINLADPFA